jgi:hypothetical protein
MPEIPKLSIHQNLALVSSRRSRPIGQVSGIHKAEPSEARDFGPRDARKKLPTRVAIPQTPCHVPTAPFKRSLIWNRL